MSKEKKKLTKIQKILILIAIIVVLAVLIVLAPILLFIGEVIFDRPSTPKVKYGEFPFELVYEYNGEQHTITDTVICEYEGIEFSLEGGNDREWNCYLSSGTEYGQYYLDEEKYSTLHIQIPLEGDYWMGDPTFDTYFAEPYLFFVDDSTGTTYVNETDLTEVVGAKIISWEPSKILEGNIK